jgi:hypothetical protein
VAVLDERANGIAVRLARIEEQINGVERATGSAVRH